MQFLVSPLTTLLFALCRDRIVIKGDSGRLKSGDQGADPPQHEKGRLMPSPKTLALQAGRELDALVAERLGWTHNRGGVGIPEHWVTPRDQAYRNLYAWSTSISAAWELVEHMVARDMSLQMAYSIRNGRKLLNVTFHKNYDLLDMITTSAQSWSDTAPLAICLAFLKATQGP